MSLLFKNIDDSMQSYGCSFTPAINKTRKEGNRRKKKEEGWEGKGGRKELAIKVSKPKEGARSWLRELRVLVKERRGDERRREPEQGLNTRRREKGRVGRGEGTRKILPFFFSLDPRSPLLSPLGRCTYEIPLCTHGIREVWRRRHHENLSADSMPRRYSR